MSDQPLDLRRSTQLVRRHKLVVAAFAVLGLAGGIVLATMSTPMLTSNALVVLPSTVHNISTQVFIATSDPVLARALRTLHTDESIESLRNITQVKSPTTDILSISVEGKTAAQAERATDAVANSYVAYANSPHRSGASVRAQILQPAQNATGPAKLKRFVVDGLLGILIGLVLGGIAVLATHRRDRRLRERDEIANALGVPVLASIPVAHPSDPARWARLLEDYEPKAAHAWQLRTALGYLGQADVSSPDRGARGTLSVAVLSLSSDRSALALGPQLAVFAASLGIPTALVIGPQHDSGFTAALRTACAKLPPSSRRPAQLMVAVADHKDMPRPPGARLIVVVGVVDGRAPNVADTMRAATTVLGVSAGAATDEQLIAVAVNATTNGCQIDGILVADPDPDDRTTGRVPRLSRPAQRRMPTRITRAYAETRR
jgi:capsular polysaccharide biosynthesis protein